MQQATVKRAGYIWRRAYQRLLFFSALNYHFKVLAKGISRPAKYYTGIFRQSFIRFQYFFVSKRFGEQHLSFLPEHECTFEVVFSLVLWFIQRTFKGLQFEQEIYPTLFCAQMISRRAMCG